MKKTVCLDFDGVCNTYTGWKGEDELFSPRAHLGDFVSSLLSAEKRVAIFSTRPSEKLRSWSLGHFPSMGAAIEVGDLFFPDRKPPADCYLDDRAVRFNGSFEEVLDQVLNFRAFWESKTIKEALANNQNRVTVVDEKGVCW